MYEFFEKLVGVPISNSDVVYWITGGIIIACIWALVAIIRGVFRD